MHHLTHCQHLDKREGRVVPRPTKAGGRTCIYWVYHMWCVATDTVTQFVTPTKAPLSSPAALSPVTCRLPTMPGTATTVSPWDTVSTAPPCRQAGREASRQAGS